MVASPEHPELFVEKKMLKKVWSYTVDFCITLRMVLLAGTNFSVLVVCCIWQVFILAFLR